MGKLIDSTDLINVLNMDTDYSGGEYSDAMLSAINTVRRRPEAYNVKKVLNALGTEMQAQEALGNQAAADAFRKAIEIVKNGGAR